MKNLQGGSPGKRIRFATLYRVYWTGFISRFSRESSVGKLPISERVHFFYFIHSTSIYWVDVKVFIESKIYFVLIKKKTWTNQGYILLHSVPLHHNALCFDNRSRKNSRSLLSEWKDGYFVWKRLIADDVSVASPDNQQLARMNTSVYLRSCLPILWSIYVVHHELRYSNDLHQIR